MKSLICNMLTYTSLNNTDNHSILCYIASLFPKVLVSSILIWTLYAFCKVTTQNVSSYGYPNIALFVSFFATTLVAISLYLYYLIVLVGPGSPLDYPELLVKNVDLLTERRTQSDNPYNAEYSSSTGLLDHSEVQEEPERPSQYMRPHLVPSKGAAYRYCTKCCVWKPDRAHHCSSCNKCILKMDHHCPWFATCIGFHNHKFFVQFLAYVAVYAGLVFVTSSIILWRFFKDEEYERTIISIKLVILFILGISFCIPLTVFSCFSIYLVLKNKSTLEFMENNWHSNNKNFKYTFNESSKSKLSQNIFDIGRSKNWSSVMGTRWYNWILPISETERTLGIDNNNGLNFQVNEKVYENWCYNIQLQNQLNDQLQEYQNRLRRDRELS